jgi:hypothetical protein
MRGGKLVLCFAEQASSTSTEKPGSESNREGAFPLRWQCLELSGKIVPVLNVAQRTVGEKWVVLDALQFNDLIVFLKIRRLFWPAGDFLVTSGHEQVRDILLLKLRPNAGFSIELVAERAHDVCGVLAGQVLLRRTERSDALFLRQAGREVVR